MITKEQKDTMNALLDAFSKRISEMVQEEVIKQITDERLSRIMEYCLLNQGAMQEFKDAAQRLVADFKVTFTVEARGSDSNAASN